MNTTAVSLFGHPTIDPALDEERSSDGVSRLSATTSDNPPARAQRKGASNRRNENGSVVRAAISSSMAGSSSGGGSRSRAARSLGVGAARPASALASPPCLLHRRAPPRTVPRPAPWPPPTAEPSSGAGQADGVMPAMPGPDVSGRNPATSRFVEAVAGTAEQAAVQGRLRLHQGVVGSFGHDRAPVDDHDAIGQSQGGPAVGDEQGRAIAHDPPEGVVDLLLGARVNRRGGHRRAPGSAGQSAAPGLGRCALALATGKGEATLAYDRVVAGGQLGDERMGLGGLCRRLDLSG